MSLFPVLGDAVEAERQELPLYREILADPETGLPVWRAGRPVIGEGAEAVRLWAVTALRTARYRYMIYSQDFGCELETLMGQSFSDDVKTAEAPRMIRDALLLTPYISDVREIVVDFAGDTLDISARLETVYGEIEIHDH